jgi:hypothetical protein
MKSDEMNVKLLVLVKNAESTKFIFITNLFVLFNDNNLSFYFFLKKHYYSLHNLHFFKYIFKPKQFHCNGFNFEILPILVIYK